MSKTPDLDSEFSERTASADGQTRASGASSNSRASVILSVGESGCAETPELIESRPDTEADVMEYFIEDSPRAKLGKEVKDMLLQGTVISDQLIIQLLNEKLNRIPFNRGWIISNFPASVAQIDQLEDISSSLQGKLRIKGQTKGARLSLRPLAAKGLSLTTRQLRA